MSAPTWDMLAFQVLVSGITAGLVGAGAGYLVQTKIEAQRRLLEVKASAYANMVGAFGMYMAASAAGDKEAAARHQAAVLEARAKVIMFGSRSVVDALGQSNDAVAALRAMRKEFTGDDMSEARLERALRGPKRDDTKS